MARPRRIWDPQANYHVSVRGNNQQVIFHDYYDVKEYFRILNYIYLKHEFQLYAYCLMSNHVHLLISSPEVHLGKLMAILNKRYSDFFRKRYKYTGQIYENRYFSNDVSDRLAMLDVGAYIHQNPIRTKKPLVEKMEDYMSSSYRFYFYNSPAPYPFLNLQLLPSLLPKEKGQSLTSYAQYCVDYRNEKNIAES